MSVPKIWHTSISRHQSLSVRESREASRLATIPTSPNATELRTRSNPSRRAEANAALDPRSLLDFHLCPAQGTHPISQLILKPLTLLVLSHLLVAGLPQVDDSFASQVLRLDFGTVEKLCHRLFLLPFERPPPECGP